ncbi:hypothetical protein GCM10010307_55980 [Streptomyces vastus]|uniref:Uncharacterized protein n=1 Tax=Streptomyces vastus TaxID=285451 RepID=A0ABN3RBE9_9ACTN
MGRRTFLASTTGAATAASAAMGQGTAFANTGVEGDEDVDFLAFLTTAADTRARSVLDGYATHLTELRDRGKARASARALRTLTSVYVHAPSAYHHDEALLGPLETLADALAEEQFDDGLWDQGAAHSPPDTAFSIVDLNLAYSLLDEDGHRPTVKLRATVERILRAAGPGLATGGLHTANHRWLVCAALAASTAVGPTRHTRAASTPGSPKASTSWRAASTASAVPPTRLW